MKEKSPRTPQECPVCGASVPPNARACPECGADERSGWNEESTRYDGLDLPDEAFDDEQPKPAKPEKRITSLGISRFWWIVGAGVTALFVYLVLSNKF